MRIQWLPLIIALVANIACDYYIYAKLAKAFAQQRWVKLSHSILSALLLIYVIVAVALPRRSIDNNGLVAIMWMLYSYFTFYVPKYIGIIIYWIGLIPSLLQKRKTAKSKVPSIIATATGLLIFITMWWGVLITRYDYEIKEVTLEYDNLPERFDGYRIAQFSDLHLGSYAGDTAYVSSLVDAINGTKCDIIFFTAHSAGYTPVTAYIRFLAITTMATTNRGKPLKPRCATCNIWVKCRQKWAGIS